MPGQLAEHRAVLKALRVDLLEGEVVRTAHHEAIRKTRKNAREAVEDRARASLRRGSLWRPRTGDVPGAVAGLFLVERTHDIIEQVRGVGFGHQPQFLTEGMRRISELKRVYETRIGGN